MCGVDFQQKVDYGGGQRTMIGQKAEGVWSVKETDSVKKRLIIDLSSEVFFIHTVKVYCLDFFCV